MRNIRTLALGAMMLVLVGACSSGGGKPTIKIGSDGFYESKLMGEIYAQALEANGYTVQRNLGLGTRAVSAAALQSGSIDLKPEYIGSGLAYYKGTATGDPANNEAALQAAVATIGCPSGSTPTTPPTCGVTVLNYSPAQDQNAFVVRKDTATQFNLTTMTQAAAIQNQLKWGLATDCPTNPVCAAALKSAYGLAPTNVTLLDACSTPMAQALAKKTIDVGELCSTQPDIAVNGFVVLQDDKQTQPADNIAPLIRNDYLEKLSDSDKTAFEALLNAVSAKMDTTTLTQLGTEISVQNKDVATVATEWLKTNGFVK